MLDSNTIKEILKSEFNIDVIDDRHISYMQRNKEYLYNDNYRRTEEIVHYSTSNENVEGINKKIQKEKKLNIPKKQLKVHLQACMEFATLMFNEKIDFFVDDDTKNKYTNEIAYLQNYYNDKKIWNKLENCFIDVLGVGAVGLVVAYDKLFKTQIQVYDASCIYPIKIVDNEIKECIFVGTDYEDNTYLSIHTMIWEDNDRVEGNNIVRTKVLKGYNILNLAYDKNGKKIEDYTSEYQTDYRMFFILKPYGRLPQNYSSAFGVPIFQDAKDIGEYIDDLFHISNKDLNITQSILMATKDLMVDEDSNIKIPSWYSNSGNIMLLANMNANSIENTNGVANLINPQSKLDLYHRILSESLKMFSLKVGLGSEGITLNKLSTPTATQVISDNSKKYDTLHKHFGQIKDEIAFLNQAILYLAKVNEDNNLNPIPITFNTMDNIKVDDETLRLNALEEYRNGLISTYDYLVNHRKLSGDALINELNRLGYDENGNKKDTVDTLDMYNNEV